MNKLIDTAGTLQPRNVTRRHFVGGALALGAASMAPRTAVAQAKKGGRLRIGLGEAQITDTLDPAILSTPVPQFLSMGVTRNCLVELGADLNLVPELAESWEASPDAKTWTFKLRKDVEFHNGKAFGAEDVLFSIDYHRGATKSAAKSITSAIEEMRADGTDTVVFTLASGNADFPALLTDYHLVIAPAGTMNWDEGIGTGPYVLQKFEPGGATLATRNPNYWKKGRGHFDEVEGIGIGDTVARTTALLTDVVDVIGADPTIFEKLREAQGIEVVELKGKAHYTMPMLTNSAPLDNNDVRLALKYAIDRELLVNAVLSGHGQPGNDHPLSAAYRYFNTDLPVRHYDPDKAKFHLQRAGLSSLSVDFYTSPDAIPNAVNAAVAFQERAAAAGININVVRVPAEGYWSDVWMKQPFCFSNSLGRPTADQQFSTYYAKDAAWNEALWNHERFNQLLLEARPELDETKRGEMYGEMQKIVNEEGGSIIPVFNNILMAYSNKLQHDPIVSSAWPYDGNRLAERWWFA